MKPKTTTVERVDISSRIITLREHRVILDADLAMIYGVSTKRLNEQVKRNARRFPEDFLFQLTTKEWADLTSQIAMSNEQSNRSQIATGSQPTTPHCGISLPKSGRSCCRRSHRNVGGLGFTRGNEA